MYSLPVHQKKHSTLEPSEADNHWHKYSLSALLPAYTFRSLRSDQAHDKTNGNTNLSDTDHPGISEAAKPDPKVSPYPGFPSSVSTHASLPDIPVQKRHYNDRLSSFADLQYEQYLIHQSVRPESHYPTYQPSTLIASDPTQQMHRKPLHKLAHLFLCSMLLEYF